MTIRDLGMPAIPCLAFHGEPMPTGASKDCLADFDVLVIGAGAAGLAAGRRLARSPLSFRILEARARPGGRGFTDSASGHALDHGCGWLHSADRNPWRGIDKTLPAWGEQAFDLGFSRQDQHDFAKASEAFHARVFNSAKTSKDQAASRLLETASRWNPLLNAVSTYMSGSALDDISVFDFAAYADSEINWRVREGFGTAITTFGGDLPVALDSAVSEIDHGGTPLRLETAKGPLKARAVIITVPASLLVCGALRFRPDLPEKRAAAEGLPLGIADKLFIALDQPEDMPIDGHLFGRTDRVETASYHLRPFGRPLIEAYFGGDLARALEKIRARGLLSIRLRRIGSFVRRSHPAASAFHHRDKLGLGRFRARLLFLCPALACRCTAKTGAIHRSTPVFRGRSLFRALLLDRARRLRDGLQRRRTGARGPAAKANNQSLLNSQAGQWAASR